MTASRAFCLLVLSLGSLIAVTGTVSAQPGQDTTAVFGFLRPTYTSSYDISRQATTWSQNFSFKNQLKGVSISNTTNYRIQTDPSRANFRVRGGDTGTQLSFTVMNYVPLSVDLSYSRTGTDDTGTQTRQNTFDSGIKATYNQRFFRGANASFAGGVGFVNRTTTLNSGRLSGSRENGLSQDLSANGSYTGPFPGMNLKLNGTFNAVRTTPEDINPVAGTPLKEPRTNTRNTFGMTWNWVPTSAVTADASFNRNQSQQRYILTSRDKNLNTRDELAQDSNTGFNASLNFKPAGNHTDFHAEVSRSLTDNNRKVEKERATEGNTLGFELKLKQDMLGSIFYVHADNTRDITETFLGKDNTVTRVVDMSIERPWTKELTTKVVGELRLRSQKYEDGLLDFDSLKNRLEGTLSYRMWSKLTVGVSGRRVSDEGVYIHNTQSVNSRLEETYGAGANLTYVFSPRTQLTQKYDFTALFTSFQFDSARATIQRTRSVNTSITTDLSKRWKLGFSHTYFFQETGGYRRGLDGTRFFNRGNLKYRQELRTSLTYKPIDWITLTTEERLYRTDDIRTSNRARTTGGQLTLTQRAGFRRPIPGGGTFSCDMAYDIQKVVLPVMGSPEKFFTARLALDKSF